MARLAGVSFSGGGDGKRGLKDYLLRWDLRRVLGGPTGLRAEEGLSVPAVAAAPPGLRVQTWGCRGHGAAGGAQGPSGEEPASRCKHVLIFPLEYSYWLCQILSDLGFGK